MENYKEVNVAEYVAQKLAVGEEPIQAEKFARIIARKGVLGEEIISWTTDSKGLPVIEKVAQVNEDENTKNPGWVVTKVDEDGNVLIDQNGYTNQWIIDDSVFQKKYEVDSENPDLFRPKSGIQIFIRVTEDIILLESNMKIAAGGYINITNDGNFYGISEKDFNDTYKIVDIDPSNRSR